MDRSLHAPPATAAPIPWRPVSPDEPVDLIATWVDGDWPGYPELLAQWAGRPVDLNPNRYRDNLETLRYALRSVRAHAPWIRRLFLVTARPQVPRWLDPSQGERGVTVVHHDELIPAERLPTFSSFAIVSHLDRIPGLARVFVYLEDDRLFGRPLARGDLFTEDGRIRLYRRLETTSAASLRDSGRHGPWEQALARSNHCLDAAYGPARRWSLKKAPLVIERDSWRAMWDRWPDALAHTAGSRFRSPGCVAPEHLYPWFLFHEGRAVPVPWAESHAHTGYLGLLNLRPWVALGLGLLALRRPRFLCLNDNFGARADPRVEDRVRSWLRARFPERAPWERV